MTLTPKTKISLGIGGVVGLALLGWNARAYFDEFRTELKDSFAHLDKSIEANRREYISRADTNAAAILALSKQQVSHQTLQVWVYQLERENRGVQRTDGKSGLVVPEPTKTQ